MTILLAQILCQVIGLMLYLTSHEQGYPQLAIYSLTAFFKFGGFCSGFHEATADAQIYRLLSD